MTTTQSTNTIAGVSTAAVQKATGKDWQEWCEMIDKIPGMPLPHKDIARYLHEKEGLSGWWSQMVTVGYENARGLRGKHQHGDTYEISRTKTINAPLSALFRAWSAESERDAWLGDHPLFIRKANPEKSMRITWSDEVTRVNVYFYDHGANKSKVAVQHVKLADSKAAEQKKDFWSASLDRLKKYLESGT